MSERHFVILCLARTGSTHLVDLLDSHPEIRCYGEILNSTHRGAAPEGWIGAAATDDAAVHADAVLAREVAPVRGFKLPLNSIRDHPESSGWLRSRDHIAILRLRRRNSLALLLSRRMLGATLVSQSIYGNYGDTKVRIEPRQCIRALGRIAEEERELDQLARGHRSIDVSYELLDRTEQLDSVLRFLGVDAVPLSSRYERVRRRSFAESIENWDELAAALAETRYSHLLDER